MSTFIKISGHIPEVKKSFDQRFGKCYCISGSILAKWGVDEQVWFVPDTVVRSGWQTWNLMGTIFPAFILTQNCCINMNISFRWKLAIQSWIVSPTNIPCQKDHAQNLARYEIKGILKLPVFHLFSELEKIWKYSPVLYSKKTFFHLLLKLGKNERSFKRATFKNPKISSWVGKNLEL